MKRSSSHLVLYAVALASVLLLALALVSVAANEKSWWGVSSITYLSPWLKWSLLLLAVACFLASILGLFTKLPNLKSFRRYAWLLLLALAVGLFVLREALPLLGDGWLLIGLTEQCASMFPVWTSDRPEPLGLLFFTTVRLLTGVDSQTLYQVISVLSGLAILLSLVWLGRRSKVSAEHRWLLGVPLFTSAALALFSGYIESYALLMALWTATLSYSVAAVQTERLPLWPLFVAVPVLFFWHHGSLVLFPTIGLAVYLRARRAPLSSGILWLLLSALFVILVLLYSLTRLSRGTELFIPFSPQNVGDGYSLLSSHHIFDFIFEMFLAAPLAFLFLSGAFFLRRDLAKDGGVQILSLAALLGLAAAFVFDPAFGMPLDWDLLATMLLPLNLLAGYAIAKAEPSVQLRSRIAGAALVSLFVVALPFVLVNHQAEKFTKRFENLLSLHPQRSGYGWEILSETVGRSDPEVSLSYLEKAAKVSSNQRYLQNIAATALQLGHRERAYPAVLRLRGVAPRNGLEATAYFYFFLEFAFFEDAEQMLPYLKKFASPGEDLASYRALLNRAKSDFARQREAK